MSGRLFRAETLDAVGCWMTDDPVYNTPNIDEAAIFDNQSSYGAYLVAYADECAIEIHWLPEDQQLRHLGAAVLPLRYPCPECGEPVHPDGVCIVCEHRHA